MAGIKQLLNHTLVFGISSVLTSAINILLVPVYARHFPPDEYAYVAIVTTTVLLLNIVITSGLDNAVSIWYYDKDSEENRRKTFSSWIWYVSIFGGVTALLIYGFAGPISRLLFGSDENDYYLHFIAVNIAFIGFQKIVNIYYRVKKQPVGAAAYAVFQSAVLISLVLFFVQYSGEGLKGVFKAQAITSLVGFVVFVLVMRNWLPLKYFDKGRLNEMLKFALPLVPASLGYWLMNYAGTYFLKSMADDREVGIYQMAYNISAMLALASTAFLQAFSPFAASHMKHENRTSIFSRSYTFYITLMIIGNLGLYFFIQDIINIFLTPVYQDIKWLTPVLGLNAVLLGVPQILLIGSAVSKTSKPYLKAVTIALPVCTLLYFLLIPVFATEGLIVAMLVTNIIIGIFSCRGSQKILYIPYRLVYTTLLIIICQAAGFLILYFLSDPQWLVLRIVLFIGAGLLILALFFKVEGIKTRFLLPVRAAS